jgi:hypothetical protein
VTPREVQLALVHALDDHDQKFQAWLEQGRALVEEHNRLAGPLHDHFRMFPESQTKPALARHPIFTSLLGAFQARLGRRAL